MTQKERIRALLLEWSSVQKFLKRAEQINQLAVIPAINELRYAGRILVFALSSELYKDGFKEAHDSEDELYNISIDEALVIGEQYIRNAKHDISDSLIYFFQKRADEINAKFGAASVAEKHPKYSDFLKNLKDARGLIIQSRGDISTRDVNYVEVIKKIDDLVSDYFVLDKSEVFFEIESEKQRSKITIYKTLSAVLGATSVVLACILIF